jgi:single-stranded-DNA-specific exonuclease
MDHRLFLGVTASFKGKSWRFRLDEAGERQALAIAQVTGLPGSLARILADRGVLPDQAEAFLQPRLRELMPDPSTLRAMDNAVERLAHAVERRETIAIFGDYDVDGACASALLSGFLTALDVPNRIHIPDRLTEGYGPNAEAIRTLHADGATLLVTVDCGTTSHEPFGVAAALGMDVVVLDHHQAPAELPDVAALVNPNRQDDMSGLGMLCAAGVVFMTLVALARALRSKGIAPPDLLAMLDLVALATIADVVPLAGLNRAFVQQGLKTMAQRARLGLTALADASRLSGPPQPYHLGYVLGPRINAGGRIGDAALGARLLTTQDPTEARAIAEQLDQLNGERQAAERIMVAEAIAALEARHGFDAALWPPLMLTADETYHPGIVGLIAARVKEHFNRPSFAFALRPDGMAVGSGRSIGGVDLGSAVRAAVAAGLLAKGGGHAMAAGATIRPEGLPALEVFLSDAIAQAVLTHAEKRDLLIDGALTARAATVELLKQFEMAGPFGSAAPEPVFGLAAHELRNVTQVGKGGHLRLNLQAGDGARLSAIAFRAADTDFGKALMAARGGRIHAALSLSLDRYGGGERVEARLIDAAQA